MKVAFRNIKKKLEDTQDFDIILKQFFYCFWVFYNKLNSYAQFYTVIQ